MAIEANTYYYKTEVAQKLGLSIREVSGLIDARVIVPVPTGGKRPKFLGREIIDAVARNLQPRE